VDHTHIIPPAGCCGQEIRTETQNIELSKQTEVGQRKAELNRVKLDLGTERTSWTVQKKTKQTKDEYSPLDESSKQQTQKI